MTLESQNKALAEFVGWKDIYGSGKLIDYMWAPGHVEQVQAHWQLGDVFTIEIPNYVGSLDAIREVEKLLFKSSKPFSSNPGDHESMRYVHNLATVCKIESREELVLHCPEELRERLNMRINVGPPVSLPIGCMILSHHVLCSGFELEMICATVQQRAEAILRTIGKWVDDGTSTG
jgi:hypothetical protein